MRTPHDYLRRTMARMFGMTHGGARDMWSTFGYPQTLTPEDFMRMYLRNGVASRIVRAYPQATWRDYPLVRDEKGDSGQKETRGRPNPNFSAFVESVENFFDQHSVTHYLERADRLSGIGRFGILVMGFGDGNSLDTPLSPGKHELQYLSAYGEPRVKITRLVSDVTNIRYALPEMYEVTPDTSSMTSNAGGTVIQNKQFKVHHSRVIHLAEFLDENEVLGTPRLMPVFNHLLDLEKTVGSGAETYWLNSRGGMAITADADVAIDPQVLEDMRQQAEEFEHQLRRTIALQGAQASLLQASIADPKSNVEAALQLIAGGVGIPMRILIGSERGELSSEQDENNWAARIDERQEGYATPRVVRPFVQKMIDTGNVLAPEGKWWVEWPSSASLSPAAQADIAVKRSQALAAYNNAPGAELIVPVQEFRADFLNLTPESEYDLDDWNEDPLGVDDLLPDQAPGEMDPSQVSTLREIIEAVGQRTMALSSAVRLITLSFPNITEAVARELVFPMQAILSSTTGDVPEEVRADTFNNLLYRVNSEGIEAYRRYGAKRVRFNAAPMTLYVRRDVLNAEEIRKHYRKQGIKFMTPADEMHVTLAYSRTPVDWLKIDPDWYAGTGEFTIPEEGARVMSLFGRDTIKRVLVLQFSSSQLSWRFEDFRRAGASWDFPAYEPHVTISYDVEQSWGNLWRSPGDTEPTWQEKLRALKPWKGPIVLGPEIFEELDEDWKSELKENHHVR